MNQAWIISPQDKSALQDEHDLAWKGLTESCKHYLKGAIEAGFEIWAQDVVGCERYQRSEQRRNYRNGYYERGLSTALGYLSLRIQRLRQGTYPKKLFDAYQRRPNVFNALILNSFIMGHSTRKCSAFLDLLSDAGFSHQTISHLCQSLDARAHAFFFRPLTDTYRFLHLDGLWVSVKYPRKSKYTNKLVVLFALGVKQDGTKELVGFKVALSESQTDWEGFLMHLYRQGLTGENLQLIIHDGDKALEAALAMVFPYAKSQRCILHKLQNVTRDTSPRYRKPLLHHAALIYRKASSKQEARRLAHRFQVTWHKHQPKAVRTLLRDFEKTLTYFEFEKKLWSKIRTNNLLERFQREVRSRIRPMGAFQGERSLNRIVYALIATYNLNHGGYIPLQFTHNP